MHYYQFNIADYRKDTMHLSRLEHGIYRDLMDWYYLDESPIPTETQSVSRRLRLVTDIEAAALENVLSDFFTLEADGYHHKRIDQEIANYCLICEKNTENGKKGGRPKAVKPLPIKEENPVGYDSVATGNPNETQINPNHKPLTTNHEPSLKTIAADKSAVDTSEDGFSDFWSAYPKRPGASKADSLKAWKARIKEGASSESLINGAVAYEKYCRTSSIEPKFIKQPATFLGPGRHFEADWTPSIPQENEKSAKDSAFLRSIGFGQSPESHLLRIEEAPQ